MAGLRYTLFDTTIKVNSLSKRQDCVLPMVVGSPQDISWSAKTISRCLLQQSHRLQGSSRLMLQFVLADSRVITVQFIPASIQIWAACSKPTASQFSETTVYVNMYHNQVFYCQFCLLAHIEFSFLASCSIVVGCADVFPAPNRQSAKPGETDRQTDRQRARHPASYRLTLSPTKMGESTKGCDVKPVPPPQDPSTPHRSHGRTPRKKSTKEQICRHAGVA